MFTWVKKIMVDNPFSLWDSFRSQIPFLTIVDTPAVEEMLRSLIDTYSHLGWLPDCRMQLNKGYTQVSNFLVLGICAVSADSSKGGSNADNILADGYIKGLSAGIDVRPPDHT